MKMEILVLGGAGRQAYATIKDLLEVDTKEVTRVIAADKDFERVKKVVESFQSDKLEAAQVDVYNHAELVKLMKDVDIVVNETDLSGGIPRRVLEAALEANTHYVDIGWLPEETEKCLELSDKFEEAGLTALIDLGSSPGVTNLIAKDIVDRLDSVETIEINMGHLYEGSMIPLKEPYFGAFDEFIIKPKVLRDGKIVELPPRSGMKCVEFPAPIGIRYAFLIPHAEIYTFAKVFGEKGIKNAGVRFGFPPDFVEKVMFLIEAGIITTDTIEVNGVKVRPLDVLRACLAKLSEQGKVTEYSCHLITVIGGENGEKVEYVAERFDVATPELGLSITQYRTGPPPSIGARMIYRGVIKKRGVFTPEMGAIDTKYFFEELRKRGQNIKISKKIYL